jgi:poly-gamma-glutamate system protein
MRKRVGKVNKFILLFYALLAIFFFFILTITVKEKAGKYLPLKKAAVLLADSAFKIVKAYRLNNGIPIDILNDPSETGLIGVPYSLITYEEVNLDLVKASLPANYAALFVELLKERRLKANDSLIVYFDGSFPALNISLLSAIKILKIKPIIFLSVASVAYGANLPNFTFLEILDTLNKAKIFDFYVDYALIGGYDEMGSGLSLAAREFIKEKVSFYKIKLITKEEKAAFFAKFKNKAFLEIAYNKINPKRWQAEYEIKEELFKGRLFYEKRYSLFLTVCFLAILLIFLYLIIKYDLEYYLFGKREEIYKEGI